MKKISCFTFVFIFIVSQSAFSDEFLNLPPQKSLSPADSRKLSSGAGGFGQAGSDLIGFGSDKTWQIHPGFDFQTTYDSNIHREPPGQRDDDIILRYIPSIDVTRQGTELEILAGYQMSFEEFLREPEESGFNHIAKSSIKYHKHRLKTTLDETFSWLKAYAGSEQSERRTVMINDVSPEITYRITPKFSLASIYQNYFFQYKDSALRENSYDINDIGGRIYYHVTPKLDFYVHGSGNIVNYFNSDLLDSHGFSILVGSKGKMTKKLEVNMATGYKGQRYDSSSINSFDGWVVKGDIRYRLTPKINATVTAKREREESVYRNVGFYRSNAVGLSLSYKVTSRINIILDSAIENNAYPSETREGTRTKKRNDTVVTSGVKLKWRPTRYLTLSVGYGFRERASNFDNLFDYVDNTLDTSVACKF